MSQIELKTPNVARLGQWLKSWIQPSGAIHGFHNHTVWGDNPYHYQEMSCGHTTFAVPVMVGLATALRASPDARGEELLARMIRYQVSSLQPDGQFDHVGFQIGDMCKVGLIHNTTPAASLAMAALILGDGLGSELRGAIDPAVRGNLDVCDRKYESQATRHSTSNQEYCRQWVKLAHMTAFDHREWDDRVVRDLDLLIAHFHLKGIPDADCDASLRNATDQDNLEPGEYYGLKMLPLMMAAKRYGRDDYLEVAFKLARHIIRSSWIDARSLRRFHRTYHRVAGKWIRLTQPMLIGGMGFTLAGMHALNQVRPDAELQKFLAETDRTYAAYQNPAGFFLAATGWSDMRDLIPSTAWQGHDFFHLTTRHAPAGDFWDTLFSPPKSAAVVFGPASMWIETETHFAVRGYHWATSQDIVGRKDKERFYVEIPAWMTSGREPPPGSLMPDEPKFLRCDDAILHAGGRADLCVYNHCNIPYRGPGTGVFSETSQT